MPSSGHGVTKALPSTPTPFSGFWAPQQRVPADTPEDRCSHFGVFAGRTPSKVVMELVRRVSPMTIITPVKIPPVRGVIFCYDTPFSLKRSPFWVFWVSNCTKWGYWIFFSVRHSGARLLGNASRRSLE